MAKKDNLTLVREAVAANKEITASELAEKVFFGMISEGEAQFMLTAVLDEIEEVKAAKASEPVAAPPPVAKSAPVPVLGAEPVVLNHVNQVSLKGLGIPIEIQRRLARLSSLEETTYEKSGD